MLTLISFLCVLSVLILVHEWGHFIAARKKKVRVERFSFGFGPRIFNIKKGDTEYCLSLFLIGGYVKMAGENPEELIGEHWEYLSKKPGERAAIVLAGPFLNYALAFVLFFAVCLLGNPTLTTKVGKVVPGLPAEKGGILSGDRILQIDAHLVNSWDSLTRIVHKSAGKPLQFKIRRNDEVFDVTLTPVKRKATETPGRKRGVGLVGILPAGEIISVKYGVLKSIYIAAEKLIYLTLMTYEALWGILFGGIPLKESLTGPIGIFFITGEAARLGFVYLLHMMGVLSMSLAIFNVLPLPVLDGGHLLFLSIEKFRRKPLNQRLQEIITQVGLFVLILAMVFVFYNDMVRFGIMDKLLNR